jgi:hypothetical protein
MVHKMARFLVLTSFVYLAASSRQSVAFDLRPPVLQAVKAGCLKIETALSEDHFFDTNSPFFEVRQACAQVLKLSLPPGKV